MKDDAEKSRVWKTLETGQDPGNQFLRDLHHWVSALTMRARLNSQRNYEIYSVHVTPEITEQYMRDAFETDREHTIKLIRERGHKIYG
jgi:hypothetical protein